MESFLYTLTIKRVFRSRYKTLDEARADILNHIERLNNPKHRHSTLKGLRPQFLKTLREINRVCVMLRESHPVSIRRCSALRGA